MIIIEYYTEEEPLVLKTMTVTSQDLFEYASDIEEEQTGQTINPQGFTYDLI